MAKKLHLEILTPEARLISDEVEYVACPGILGQFGILGDHIPLLSALGVGRLDHRTGHKEGSFFVSGGFVEVRNNKVVVLAEVAEAAGEIDVERALWAKERAEESLYYAQTESDVERAQAALGRARTRLKIAGMSIK